MSRSGYYVGGLVGGNLYGSTTSNSYYDSQTSGQSDEGKGTSKTTAQMKQQATFAGWDFEHIWVIDEGNDYPKLLLVNDDIPNDNTPIIANGTFSGNFDLQVKNGMLWIAIGSLPRATTRGNDVIVQFYNLNGAKVRSLSLAGGTYSVSLENLPKGMYIVRAVFGSERKVQRVMN